MIAARTLFRNPEVYGRRVNCSEGKDSAFQKERDIIEMFNYLADCIVSETPAQSQSSVSSPHFEALMSLNLREPKRTMVMPNSRQTLQVSGKSDFVLSEDSSEEPLSSEEEQPLKRKLFQSTSASQQPLKRVKTNLPKAAAENTSQEEQVKKKQVDKTQKAKSKKSKKHKKDKE